MASVFSISGQTLDQWYRWAKQEAIAAEIPASEVDWLLQTVTPLDSLSLRLGLFKERSQIPLQYPLSN